MFLLNWTILFSSCPSITEVIHTHVCNLFNRLMKILFQLFPHLRHRSHRCRSLRGEVLAESCGSVPTPTWLTRASPSPTSHWLADTDTPPWGGRTSHTKLPFPGRMWFTQSGLRSNEMIGHVVQLLRRKCVCVHWLPTVMKTN